MKITIKFSGEMEMDVDIDELLHTELSEVVENFINDNMSELMDSIVTVEE